MKHLFPGTIAFAMALSLCLCCCFTVSAQMSAGIEGGYDRNYIITNNANRAFTNYGPMNGFSVGIPLQYHITDWFAIAADPSFIKKSYNQRRSDFFAGVFQDTYNSYVQVPLMGHFMFGGKRLKGFFNAGVYAGYWLTSRVKGTMPNILNLIDSSKNGNSVYNYENSYSYNEKYSFNSRKDNRMDAGWAAGTGLSYYINKRYEIFVEGRLLYSFTDQQKNYELNQVPRYNTTYGVNAGIMYRFHNSKTSF